APSVSGNATYCGSGSSTLTATGPPTGSYKWYAVGGGLVDTGTTYTPPTLTSSQGYYVIHYTGVCPSNAAFGSITINPYPVATLTAPDTLCSSVNPFIIGTGTTGGSWSGTGITDTLGTFNPGSASIGTNKIH